MNIDIKEEYKGRWASILIGAGVDGNVLNGKHQPCPLCSGKDRFRWIADTETAFCSQCGVRGGIDFLMEFAGHSFREACEYIRGEKVEYKQQEKKIKVNPINRLKQIHKGLKPITPGDLVSTYLERRGITKVGSDIFTSSSIPYYGGFVDGKKVTGVFTAMIARITNLDGSLQSYHVTYLNDHGFKIDFAAAKIIITPMTTITGCSIKLAEPVNGQLCVAEGLETALAIQQEEGVPTWSAINANGMIKMEVPSTVTNVNIFLDNDQNFTGHAAAYQLANRLAVKGVAVTVINDCEIGDDYLDLMNKNKELENS